MIVVIMIDDTDVLQCTSLVLQTLQGSGIVVLGVQGLRFGVCGLG